ncbi:MAG: GtrA family protein [Gallionellaceae bacterium]|nr:GtrA family protein [Gallionellaceae bacterium]
MIFKFLRFATVGAIGTSVHYVILWGLVTAGTAVLLATTVGAIGGALVNYILNYRYTFNSDLAHRSALVKFFTVALIGLLLNTVMMALLTQMHYFIAQIITTFFVLLWNYIGNLLWTFRMRKNDHG